MEEKIKQLIKKLHEVEEELVKPETISDQKRYKELTQEHSQLSNLKDTWDHFQKIQKQLQENTSLLSEEKDPELIEMINQEIEKLQKEVTLTRSRIETLLVPPDPRDSRNIIMEIRAGTGGEEAALFVGNCVRMYKNYADKKGWHVEVLSCTESERGGFKEYIMVLSGPNVFRFMQYEAGTHRVQRVPETETQGRVHTSAITIAILLEPSEEEKIDIDDRDLRIETYRASGAGGQHVNVTDSAVRITHMPTGTVVSCQDERSQHKNKAKAMRILGAKVAEQKRIKEEKEMAAKRQAQVGSGDRSERIRTYNFPQNRLTDHRINLTLYNLDLVMEGDLDEIANALVAYYHHLKMTT